MKVLSLVELGDCVELFRAGMYMSCMYSIGFLVTKLRANMMMGGVNRISNMQIHTFLPILDSFVRTSCRELRQCRWDKQINIFGKTIYEVSLYKKLNKRQKSKVSYFCKKKY